MTYEELGEHFQCDADEPRAGVIENSWPRRRCSDELIRVKLPPTLAHEVMVAYAAKFNASIMTTDEMVVGLRQIVPQAEQEAPAALVSRA